MTRPDPQIPESPDTGSRRAADEAQGHRSAGSRCRPVNATDDRCVAMTTRGPRREDPPRRHFGIKDDNNARRTARRRTIAAGAARPSTSSTVTWSARPAPHRPRWSSSRDERDADRRSRIGYHGIARPVENGSRPGAAVRLDDGRGVDARFRPAAGRHRRCADRSGPDEVGDGGVDAGTPGLIDRILAEPCGKAGQHAGDGLVRRPGPTGPSVLRLGGPEDA